MLPEIPRVFASRFIPKYSVNRDADRNC